MIKNQPQTMEELGDWDDPGDQKGARFVRNYDNRGAEVGFSGNWSVFDLNFRGVSGALRALAG